MVNRTNVNDAAFLGDWIFNDDYLRDLNAEDLAIRDLARDIYGPGAFIFEGLEVTDGTVVPDSILITAGRARDLNKYHIVVPANLDNYGAASIDASGAWNYIAIRHIWTYAGPRPAVKTATAYNSQRADAYEIGIAGIAYNEAAGWVNLCRRMKSGAVWLTEFVYPYRSKLGRLDQVAWDFTYPGPGALALPPALMFRHGINLDVFSVPSACRMHRIVVRAGAGGADTTTCEMLVNGVATVLGVTLPAASVGPLVYNYAYGVPLVQDDLIQIRATAGLGGGATDITAMVAGYREGPI